MVVNDRKGNRLAEWAHWAPMPALLCLCPVRSTQTHQPCNPATPQRARWVPGSARLVLLAARASGAGCLRVYELQGAGLALRGEAASAHALHSGTFAASSLAERHLAAGDASGLLPSGSSGLIQDCAAAHVWKPEGRGGAWEWSMNSHICQKNA